MINLCVTEQEHAAILAGLRILQRWEWYRYEGEDAPIPSEYDEHEEIPLVDRVYLPRTIIIDEESMYDILTSGETHPALTNDEIDALCERLNHGGTDAPQA